MPKVTEAYMEARRQEILEAAITCFTRKGFHQTTMDDICEEAGVSPGAVYGHFASKEEIIQAAVQKGRESEVLRWFEEEVTRFDDFLSVMEIVDNTFYRRFEEDPGTANSMKLRLRAWAEALQNPGVRKEVVGRWELALGLTEKLVRRAQELGQINPDLDPGAAAHVLQAISEGFRLLWTINPDFDIAEFRKVEMALYSGTFRCGQQNQADRQ